MNAENTYIPKGMRDFLPNVMFRRNYIFKTVKSAFERYGYMPIETPSIESVNTLTGKYGEEGDQLIFKILNSGDYLSGIEINKDTSSFSLTNMISNKALRYDLTVPFARFVVQNRNGITFPFKRYQMQNVWRADKPQRGRFREFYQCDADVIGTDSLLCEVELIQLYDDVFTKLNISDVNICINNRKILTGMVDLMGVSDLFSDIVIILDKLSSLGIEKVKELLRAKGINNDAINILDFFLNANQISELELVLKDSEIGKKGLEELKFVMNKVNRIGLETTNLVFDITLARGLNYYTGCILEVKSNSVIIGSIGGGGRYDNLTSNFGLDNISGVGVSFGIDRIYLVMEELGLFPDDIDVDTKVMFVNFGESESNYCLPLLKKLRSSGINSEIYPTSEKMKKQMSYANKKGFKFVVLVGEDEMSSGILTVKEMNTGEQYNLSLQELINKLM